LVAIRPILSAPASANHNAPSGPVVMRWVTVLGVEITNSLVTVPSTVMRPILLPPISVNQSAPSGPATIPPGLLPAAVANSVTTPLGVTRPILLLLTSVNQTLPSGPSAMLNGPLAAVARGNSFIQVCPCRRGSSLRARAAAPENEFHGYFSDSTRDRSEYSRPPSISG
jgi:hypothetical protein